MSVVLGSSVKIVFLHFKGSEPDLFYAKGEGSTNVASVNAGNSASDCLCVGLGGVNGAFLKVLSITQKRANLSVKQQCVAGNFDDYQDRHLKLLAQADGGGSPWEVYTTTDPCQFSLVNPKRINQANGFVEGVCFVDVFDAALTPEGNMLNAAMLYMAPPYGGNYATKAAFLAAIEATAANMIETVSDYNALAAKQGLPVIEALRNTLYSSGFYNQNPKVQEPGIALAIFKGLSDALNKYTNSGLLELQFPVRDAAQHPTSLFGAVQQALAAGSTHAQAKSGAGPRAMMMMPPGASFSAPDEGADDNDDGDELEERSGTIDVESQGDSVANAAAGGAALQPAADALKNATSALDADLLKHSRTLQPSQYQSVAAVQPPVQQATGHYISANLPLDNYSLAEFLPTNYSSLNTDAVKSCRTTVDAASNASTALDRAAIASDRAGRDQAINDATEAAKTTRREANNALASDNANQNSQAQTELVKRADQLATRTVNTVKTAKAHYDAIDNVNEARRRRALLKILGAVAGVTVLTGIAIGLSVHFLVNGGGDQAKDSPKAQDLHAEGVDLGAAGIDDVSPVSVDVLAQNLTMNMSFPAGLVKVVHLTDSTGTIADTTVDGWSVSGTTITYTPTKPHKSGETVFTYYTLEYTDGAIPKGQAAKLTITFVDKAVDRVAAAVTSSGITRAVFKGIVSDQLVFTPVDKDAWTTDAATGTATFTRLPAVTTAAVGERYQLGKGLVSNSARLVVLLPPSDVNSTDASTKAVTSIALPDPGVVGVMWTLLDSQGKATTSVDGWSVLNADGSGAIRNAIIFMPGSVAPAAGSTAKVMFALSAATGGTTTLSEAASASITFAAGSSTTFPKAADVVFVASNRTDATFTIAFPKGVDPVLPAAGASGGGRWISSKGQVTFSPDATLSGKSEATNTYTAANLTGSANVTIVFPLDIVLTGLNRQGPILIDIEKLNPDLFGQQTLQSLAVTDTVPSKDPSNGTWTDLGAAMMSPMPGVLQFQPPANANPQIKSPAVVQANQIVKEYQIKFTDGSTSTARLTLNFDDTLKAYDIDYTATPAATAITFDVAANYHIPAGATLKKISVSGAIGDGQWAADSTTLTVSVSYKIVGSIISTGYTITDSNGRTSSATITVRLAAMLMPRTANYLLTRDVWSPQKSVSMVGMDVLKNCKAFFGIDRSTLILTSPVDFGADYDIPDAVRTNDCKSLRIPNEGSWLVTDDGQIAFVAETGLTTPPTPIGFRFSDSKGHLSDEGVVIIHPDLDTIMGLPAALKGSTDDDFWTSIWANVVCSTNYSKEEFAASLTLLAETTRVADRVGRDPVSAEDFDKGFQTWFKAGKRWQESGKEDPAGLFAICRDLVDTATKGTKLPLRPRYWRLTLMARMIFYSPMLDLIEQS